MNVTYHSVHGAIQESVHVFIKAGLYPWMQAHPGAPVHLFEMGLGTGLNALLTLAEAERLKRPVHYAAVELFPMSKDEIVLLNYCTQLQRPDLQSFFERIHDCEWEKDVELTPYFTLHKIKDCLTNVKGSGPFDLVYFDAFAPLAQPGLWTKEIFEKIYSVMNKDALLVTYCSKGDVRRAMQACGFHVEKIEGPPGKREMIRASRPS